MKFKTNKIALLLFALTMIIFSGGVHAQSEKKDAKKRGSEYYAKKKEKDKEKSKDGNDSGKLRHKEIQTKETRKRMKRTAKKSKRQKRQKKSSSFFRRAFRKNR